MPSLDLESTSSQYASIADASQTGLDLTGDFTLECWIKLEELPSTLTTDMAIITKWDTTLNQRNYRIFGQASTNNLVCEVTTDGTTATLSSHNGTTFFVAADVATWVHIAVTFQSSTNICIFYKNGVSFLTSDLAGAPAPFNGTAPFALGTRFASGVAGNFYDGLIDDARVWATIRTAAQIAEALSHPLVGNDTNLKGYWKLDNNYNDSTSNANNLTATGSPVFTNDTPFSPNLLLMGIGT